MGKKSPFAYFEHLWHFCMKNAIAKNQRPVNSSAGATEEDENDGK